MNLATPNPSSSRPQEPNRSSRKRPFSTQAVAAFRALLPPEVDAVSDDNQSNWVQHPAQTIIDASYFTLLSRTSTPQPSRPITPTSISEPSRSNYNTTSSSTTFYMPQTSTSVPVMDPEEDDEPLGDAYRVDGYYDRFFVEDLKLGRGEKGSVFLCTHVLYGHREYNEILQNSRLHTTLGCKIERKTMLSSAVGHFAVKKVSDVMSTILSAVFLAIHLRGTGHLTHREFITLDCRRSIRS